MDPIRLEQILSEQWRQAVGACCNKLENDDLRQVSVYNSWDNIEAQMRAEFAGIAPELEKVKVFIDYWLVQAIPKLDTTMIRGMVRLVVKIAREEPPAIAPVIRMLRELCHKIDIHNNYCQDAQAMTPEFKESCVETASALLSFLSYVVSFMRKYLLDNKWQHLETQFSSTMKTMDEILSRMEALAKFAARTSQSEDLTRKTSTLLTLSETTSLPDDSASPRCVILPAIRTSRFFDRTDVMKKIEDHFSVVDSTKSFRSLAIYGLGGVGKSTVALRYAELKLQRGELDALFWVYSEKLASIQQSFTDIAMRLKLPDARPGDHDENRALVLDWLQRTQRHWLIVYDNAESTDLLRSHWPIASHGQALITTRNHAFAFRPADGGLEIPTWDNETGSRFLLHLLSVGISMQLEKDEAASASELSQRLSGHALAIENMAGLIHRRSWSIAEFMSIYNKHPSKMHGTSDHSAINALWDFAFQSLDPKSSTILGVLSFLSPDNIPQELFKPESTFDLPSGLEFCSDPLQFFEAIENLLSLAFIKRDGVTRTFSLHRLVQDSFKHYMSAEQRQQRFNEASILVSRAFPRRDSNIAQLYLMWSRCALYVQHVLKLKDCFREERKLNQGFTALQTYCDLNNACQKYLLETNSYTDLQDLLEINTEALSLLPEEQQIIALKGSLTSHKGQLAIRLGRPEEGVEWLKKSYEIRSHDVPFNPRESAWAAENAANGIATLNEFQEAIKWYELAREHWQEWSNKQDVDRGEWPACIKKSMGMALAWSNQSSLARNIANLALKQIETTTPYNWAMAAYTHFALGTADRLNRKYESAEAHFMEAQNLWEKGDQLRTDPFNAACMYRLGCTALDQGKLEAAVKHLRDAKAVTGLRNISMKAEHSRCLFKLSEVLEQEPREALEARELRDEAEQLLNLRAPNAKDPGLESTYDGLINILWR